MIKSTDYGFADIAVEGRIIRSTFLKQVELIIDWNKIDCIIKQHYKKGISSTGHPAYAGLMLFKMNLLQYWFGLSDYEVEDQVNDRISFSKFIGLSLEQKAPDHSVISKFRTILSKTQAYTELLREINQQLESKGFIVKTGAIVDASITDSPRKPRGKQSYEIITEASTDNSKVSSTIKKELASHVDTEAKWVIKNGKPRFGFKKHVITDQQGLLLGVLTTSANVNESSNLKEVVETVDLAKGLPLQADKGYKSKRNDELLAKLGLVNQIMHKAYRGKPLSDQSKQFNKLISKTRFVIERTFGGIKSWFKGGTTRYVGLEKTHTQHLLEAIAYNLYRMPRLAVSKP